MKHPSTPVPCPRCGKQIEHRKSGCPHCGYHGYIPMTEEEIKRVRRTLYPIFAVAAALAILVIWLISK